MRTKLIICFFCFVGLLSCSKEKKTETLEQLNIGNYSWDSFKVSEMRAGMTYSATQLPIEYYLRKNIGVDKQKEVDSLVETMKTERVIIAEFNHLSQKDVLIDEYTHRSYEDAVKYIASPIYEDYKFVTSSQDTIPCSGVLFERNFNVAPFKRVLLYFNGVPPGDTGELVYNDQLFGNGSFTFKLNKKPLKN